MAFHQIKSTEIGELSKRFLQVTHVYDSMMELPWRFQPEINQWIHIGYYDMVSALAIHGCPSMFFLIKIQLTMLHNVTCSNNSDKAFSDFAWLISDLHTRIEQQNIVHVRVSQNGWFISWKIPLKWMI